MYKIKLWFLKSFFPDAYYREIWSTSLRRVSKSMKGATVCMRELAKALEEYSNEEERHQ